jgi:hypothetical protein
MRHLLTSVVALALVTAPVAAASADPAFDRVIADARNVRLEAAEVKQLLGNRAAHQAVVLQRLSVLAMHAAALDANLDAIDPTVTPLTLAEGAALERARAATDTLLVLLENKTALIEDFDRMQRQRGLLRAKADAIVARARIVEQQIGLLLG